MILHSSEFANGRPQPEQPSGGPLRYDRRSQEGTETMLSRLEYFAKAPELMRAVPDRNEAIEGSGLELMQSGCLRPRVWPEDEASAIVRG